VDRTLRDSVCRQNTGGDTKELFRANNRIDYCTIPDLTNEYLIKANPPPPLCSQSQNLVGAAGGGRSVIVAAGGLLLLLMLLAPVMLLALARVRRRAVAVAARLTPMV